MNAPFAKVRRLLVSEDGPTAVEYAVMLALIITACFSVIKTLGATPGGMFSSAVSAFGS